MIKKLNIKKTITILCVAFALYACNSKQKSEKKSRTDVLPYYNEATFTPVWLETNSAKINNLHTIPSFSFLNQDGQTITNKTFDNKIYVTDFFFTTCPGICPAMTKNMNAVQDAFKNDDEVLLLSHSVTPEKDSVAVLKNYAKAHGVISGKWHLVTGEQEKIYELGRKSYFVEEDLGLQKSLDEFLHTENFILVDKNKHIRGIYNGLNNTSIKQLITDIKTLKKEK